MVIFIHYFSITLHIRLSSGYNLVETTMESIKHSPRHDRLSIS